MQTAERTILKACFEADAGIIAWRAHGFRYATVMALIGKGWVIASPDHDFLRLTAFGWRLGRQHGLLSHGSASKEGGDPCQPAH